MIEENEREIDSEESLHPSRFAKKCRKNLWRIRHQAREGEVVMS